LIQGKKRERKGIDRTCVGQVGDESKGENSYNEKKGWEREKSGLAGN